MIVIKHKRKLQNQPKVKVKYFCCDNSGENHEILIYIRDRTIGISCKFDLQHQTHHNRMIR
jgi:hypothetical protein